MKSITYPDGELVTYDDDGTTRMIDINSQLVGGSSTPLVVVDQPAPWGAPSRTVLATTPNTTTASTYDSRERLTSEKSGPSSPYAADQNFTLTYDDASNVKTTTDGTTDEVATYGYDALNRLTSMGLTLNGHAEPGAAYGYDQGGRMNAKSEGAASATLEYPGSFGSGPAHAVTQVSQSGSAATLTYDANGNLCAYRADNGAQTCSPPAGNSTAARTT